MTDISQCPTMTLLTRWASCASRYPYAWLASNATSNGYAKLDKRTEAFRPLSAADLRREVKRRLVEEGYLPLGRRPTPTDYDEIKRSILQVAEGELA